MKNITLLPLAILLGILSYACTGDEDDTPINAAPLPVTHKSNSMVGNTANPFDDTGSSYRDFLSSYKAGSYSPNNLADVYTVVRNLASNPEAPVLSTETQTLLSACVTHPEQTLSALLQRPELSQKARGILSGLVGDFHRLSSEPFSKAYTELTAIESAVIVSTLLSEDERRIILSLASVMRYALYHSCCEDTDWEKSVGNIVAALAGSFESNVTAVEYALITSIAGLEKIQL